MISKETISLVRDRTDIIAVISESVPSLKKRGRRFLGLCPFHKEKTPSFNVNPDTGLYHCFGCKESGDAIRFLERVEGYAFAEAVRALAERAGVPIEEERGAAPSEAERHKKERSALYAAMQMAATWYEEQLREHPLAPLAVAELARRELAPTDEAVNAFRLGYAPGGWDGLASFFKKQSVSPAVGESVGLLVPRSSGSGYYDRFRHRLMFPVLDVQGRIVAFSGRALPAPPEDEAASATPAEPPPKYINSPESPIYVKGATVFGLWQARHAVRQQEKAILVEGNFDVVSLHARGVTNVVAPLGTAFTLDQAKLLRQVCHQPDAPLRRRRGRPQGRDGCARSLRAGGARCRRGHAAQRDRPGRLRPRQGHRRSGQGSRRPEARDGAGARSPRVPHRHGPRRIVQPRELPGARRPCRRGVRHYRRARGILFGARC